MSESEPEVFYRKVGKRYRPVGYGEYLRFTQGAHLVVVDDGWKFSRFDIDPDRAALLAASKLAHSAVTKIISKASEAKYSSHNEKVKNNEAYRAKCEKAWAAYKAVMGDDAPMAIWFPSVSDIAEEIVDEMLKAAKKGLENDSSVD